MQKCRPLTDRLVDAENQACSLDCGLDRVDLDQARLPDKCRHVVPDSFVVKVHAGPDIALAVFHAQSVQDVRGIEAGIVAQLARDHFQGLGERLDHCLLLMGDVSVGKSVHVAGQLHFAGTTASNDGCVAQRTLDDHDGVVKASLDFRNKLFRSTTQHQRTCPGFRAFGEEVEPLPTNLALLERPAGAEVTLLDVAAC